MPTSQKIMGYGGIAAALLGLVTALFGLSSAGLDARSNVRPTVPATILYILVWVVPRLLLAAGAYTYVFNQKRWRLKLLLISAIINDFVIIATFVGVVWLNPTWIVLLVVLEFMITTIVIFIAFWQESLKS